MKGVLINRRAFQNQCITSTDLRLCCEENGKDDSSDRNEEVDGSKVLGVYEHVYILYPDLMAGHLWSQTRQDLPTTRAA
jgi:hypothetical protein